MPSCSCTWVGRTDVKIALFLWKGGGLWSLVGVMLAVTGNRNLGRRKAIHGGCGKNFLFFTPQIANPRHR
jgi:hypothetical protein